MHDPRVQNALEERLATWRTSLRTEGLAGAELDELEDHLRSCVEAELLHTGSLEKAWETSLARLGRPKELAGEFAKLTPPSRLERTTSRLVMATGAGLALMLAGLGGAASWRASQDLWLTGHVALVSGGYALALTLGVLGIAFAARRLCSRPEEAPPHRRDSARLTRTIRRTSLLIATLTALGTLLGCVWAHAELGRAWSWDPRETGALLVVLFHSVLVGLTVRQPRRHLGHISLAAAGGGLTLLAWFGAHGWSAGGMTPMRFLLLALGFGLSTGLGLALQLRSSRARTSGARRASR